MTPTMAQPPQQQQQQPNPIPMQAIYHSPLIRCRPVGLWPSGIFHFSFLSTFYLVSGSLPLGYKDLGPLLHCFGHFKLHLLSFLGQSMPPAFRSEISWPFGLIHTSRLDMPRIRKHPDQPPSLSRITRAKHQLWCWVPCPFRK